MTRTIALVAFAMISGHTIPAVAAECSSITEIATSQIDSKMARARLADPADVEKTCRAYAASFYRIVLARQAAATCGPDRQRDLAILDQQINAFNDLLATKCGG
jgi:hypothetical protein